jgi:AbiJ N-terminal domain 5
MADLSNLRSKRGQPSEPARLNPRTFAIENGARPRGRPSCSATPNPASPTSTTARPGTWGGSPSSRLLRYSEGEENGVDLATGQRIIDLRARIVGNFSESDWHEVGLLTGGSRSIDGHSRLLRSLSWRDDDYDGNVLDVLKDIVSSNPSALPVIESYVDRKYPGEGQYVSAKPSERKITFAPNVFQVPDAYVELDLVAVMMPFSKEFDPVYAAIGGACKANALRCLRADDIWDEPTIIQDIFNLIFRAQVIVVDFSGRNPNVMYETGIAHTLGKHVVPITQSLDDVPFDMRHHRTLKYLPNAEGLAMLGQALIGKLKQFSLSAPRAAPIPLPLVGASDDDIPF